MHPSRQSSVYVSVSFEAKGSVSKMKNLLWDVSELRDRQPMRLGRQFLGAKSSFSPAYVNFKLIEGVRVRSNFVGATFYMEKEEKAAARRRVLFWGPTSGLVSIDRGPLICRLTDLPLSPRLHACDNIYLLIQRHMYLASLNILRLESVKGYTIIAAHLVCGTFNPISLFLGCIPRSWTMAMGQVPRRPLSMPQSNSGTTQSCTCTFFTIIVKKQCGGAPAISKPREAQTMFGVKRWKVKGYELLLL